MTLEEIFYEVRYYGDSVEPPDGHLDLRAAVTQTIHKLPDDIRDWLLFNERHVFIGGHGQLGEFFQLGGADRAIFLSEKLMLHPIDEVHWTIAHEIAHSYRNHSMGGYDDECEADELANEWGFQEPKGRAADRKLYKTRTKPRKVAAKKRRKA